MFRRLRAKIVGLLGNKLVDFVRRWINRWANGEIDKAQREEEWEDQRDTFKDAADRWRRK